MNPRAASTDTDTVVTENGSPAPPSATVTTVSRGHVVRWLGDGWQAMGEAPGWNAVPPGLRAGVVVRGFSKQSAAEAARQTFPHCDQVRAEKERMRCAEARFQEHLKQALDAWAQEVPEDGVDWRGRLFLSVAYQIRGQREVVPAHSHRAETTN